jgi:hypothetical protein
MAKQVIVKIELIIGMHKNILGNVEKAQQKQKRTYDLKKEKQMFLSFVVGHGEVEDTRKKKGF